MNSRFAVATHVLSLLHEAAGAPCTSEDIAGSVNTNPAVIRRILSMLARAGLTTSQLGAGGGALLARPAGGAITLLEVYRAVDEGELVGSHAERPNPACPVGRHIQAALEQAMDGATRAFEAELARQTIGGLADDIRRRERRKERAKAAR